MKIEELMDLGEVPILLIDRQMGFVLPADSIGDMGGGALIQRTHK